MKQVKSTDEVPCSHRVESTVPIGWKALMESVLKNSTSNLFRVETKITCDRGFDRGFHVTVERAAGF